MLPDIDAYRGYISSALKYDGCHTFEDVKAAVERGDMQFWPAPSSVIVTEINDYPQCRIVRVFLAAGNRDEIQRMQKPLEDWARSQGCTRAQIIGRKGWSRTFLTQTGFVETMSVYEKPLDGEEPR